MRLNLRCLLLSAVLLGSSCAREPRSPAGFTGTPVAPTRETVTPTGGRQVDENPFPQIIPVIPVQGRVVFLNPRLRFVIVDFAFHRLPLLEQRLGVFRDGRRVGEVRISGPADGTTIVADVMSGEAAVGDLVREE